MISVHVIQRKMPGILQDVKLGLRQIAQIRMGPILREDMVALPHTIRVGG